MVTYFLQCHDIVIQKISYHDITTIRMLGLLTSALVAISDKESKKSLSTLVAILL